jgi:urease accessory protein UreF
MKILVFGASGPLGRRSTEAARTQSLKLGRRLPRAVARVWPHPPSVTAEDLVRSHNAGPCRCGIGLLMIGQRPA